MAKPKKPQKPQSLDEALLKIQKEYGEGSIFLGETGIVKCDFISTGCLPLDIALGVGGIPKGRVTEIFGPEGGGKTTLALHVVAGEQDRGGVAAFIDAEHAIDPLYAKKLGVDYSKVYISQPDSGEQALGIVETLVESGGVDLIVVDSVAALVPQAELDGEIGDHHIGAQARMMSQALRKITGSVSKNNVALIFINQMREKIGVIGFGEKTTTPGGRALKFYASVRIDIRRIGSTRSGDKTYGNQVRAKIVKNKVAPPFRQADFDIIFGKGIDGTASILDLAVEHKIVSKSGSWFTYNNERMGNGKEEAVKWLDGFPDILKEIEDVLKDGLLPGDKDIEADGEEALDG